MNGLMLIVRMADEVVAFAADRVESVVEIEAVTPIPLAPAHIAGLAALRSRVLTMVDPRAVLGRTDRPHLPYVAIVVVIDGHPYGIIADEVLDVREATGMPVPFQARIASEWAALARQTVIVDGPQHVLIDPEAMIAGGTSPVPAPPPAAPELVR